MTDREKEQRKDTGVGGRLKDLEESWGDLRETEERVTARICNREGDRGGKQENREKTWATEKHRRFKVAADFL